MTVSRGEQHLITASEESCVASANRHNASIIQCRRFTSSGTFHQVDQQYYTHLHSPIPSSNGRFLTLFQCFCISRFKIGLNIQIKHSSRESDVTTGHNQTVIAVPATLSTSAPACCPVAHYQRRFRRNLVRNVNGLRANTTTVAR